MSRAARLAADPQACPADEQRRRDMVTAELYYVRLVVDGVTQAHTPPRPLTLAFSVALRQSFSIPLARMPSGLVLQLWRATSPHSSAAPNDVLVSGAPCCGCACCMNIKMHFLSLHNTATCRLPRFQT